MIDKRELWTKAKRLIAPAGFGGHFWCANAAHSSNSLWKPYPTFDRHKRARNEYNYTMYKVPEGWDNKHYELTHDMNDDKIVEFINNPVNEIPDDKIVLIRDHRKVQSTCTRMFLYGDTDLEVLYRIMLEHYKKPHTVIGTSFMFSLVKWEVADLYLDKVNMSWTYIEDFFMIDDSKGFRQRWYDYEEENRKIFAQEGLNLLDFASRL